MDSTKIGKVTAYQIRFMEDKQNQIKWKGKENETKEFKESVEKTT